MRPRLLRLLAPLAGIVAIPAALVAAGAALANRAVEREAARIRALADAPEAPVAIVFGAGVGVGGALSSVLEDRVRTGVALYRAGKVRKLLLSGDHGRKGYDEPTAMAAFAERSGVAPEDIFCDHAGFDTWSTLYRARDVFLVRRALLVTQRYHLPRALYIARRLGIEATGVAADRRVYAHRRAYAAREALARAKAVLWAEVLRPAPRFLGPAIPIEGDGRATR